MIPCGCWDRNHCQKAMIVGTAKREGRRGNEIERDGRRRSDREWDWETEREGMRVWSEMEWEWEWEWERLRVGGNERDCECCFESFLSAICRTRGGPKRNWVQWTRFQCIKTKSIGVNFYVQKPSILDSVSMYKNQVQWTRFLGVRGHFVLGVCKLSPEPTTPTGTDPPAPPLAPTDVVNAGDRNVNGAPMPVRWGHWSHKSRIE